MTQDSRADRNWTQPDDIVYIRDVVQPQVKRSVSKQYAPFSDLLDRDELVGVVMEKYFKKWGRSDRPDHIGAWVKTVVHAAIVDEVRRRQVRPHDRLAAEPDRDERPDGGGSAIIDQAFADLATPSLMTHHKLLLLEALEALGERHPEDVRLIRLRFEHGMKVREIAEHLGENEEKTKKRIQAATRRARSAVKAIDPTFS